MNMRKLKIGVCVVASVYLTLGYIGNQLAYAQGLDALRSFVVAMQNPGIVMTSLIIFVLAVALSFVPEKEQTS